MVAAPLEEGSIWPFVGRSEPLAMLERAVRGGTPGGVLVRGAPGIGKSALGELATAQLQAEGRRMLVLHGRQADARTPLSGLAGPLADLRRPFEVGAEAAELATAAHHLATAGWDGIWVDDVDGLDGPSAQVLRHLAATAQVPLLLAARSGTTLPEPIVALRVEGSLAQVSLGPLTDGEVTELLESVLGSQVEAGAARRFALLSEGHPLHLRELIRAALARQVLDRHGGLVRWSPAVGGAWELGGLLRERVSALEEPVHRAASLVALAGELPRAVVARMVGGSAVDDAIRTGILELRSGAPTRVAVVDPVMAEVLVDALDRPEVAALQAELAEAFAPGAPHADPVRSVAFRHAAGESVPDELVLAAAADAQRRGAPDEAARLHRTLRASRPVEANLGLGEALLDLGDDREAGLAFSRAIRHGAEGDLLARCELGHHRATRRSGPSDPEPSRRLARLAERAPAELARPMLVEAAAGLSAAGHPAEALDLLSTPGAAAPEIDPTAAGVAAIALAVLGRTEEASALLDDAAAEAAKRGATPGWWPTEALALPRIVVLLRRGDALALRRMANELRGQAGRTGHLTSAGAHAPLAEGLADLLAGDGQTAIRPLRQAADWGRRAPGAAWTVVLSRSRLASALASVGDLDAARAELDDLEAAIAPSPLAVGEVALARAWCAVHAPGSDRSIAAGEDRPAHLAALHVAWRRRDGVEADLAERIAAVGSGVDGPEAAAIVDQASGWSRRDASQLERAADGFAELGRWLDAAEAAADAAGVHWADGNVRAAAAAVKAADRLLARSGSPGSVRARPHIDLPALTDREREIAALAGAGCSNRAIAERLVLSVRTVEGHLLRASAKMGVDSRVALAEVVATWPTEREG